MPIDSSQIAQMNGMYLGMSMNQLAYAQQIGSMPPPGFGMHNGAFGDQAMGAAMNAAGAIGGPMASAMGALAPMGLSAGLALGMMGSTAVGLLFAAGMAGM